MFEKQVKTIARARPLEESYRKPLLIAFWLHIVVFFIILISSFMSSSSALIDDAFDFIRDAANFAISIYLLNKSIKLRAYVSILKAILMIITAIPVLKIAINHYNSGEIPNHEIMSFAGIIGTLTHIICLYYLVRLRNGDVNVFCAWIFALNDMLANLLIIASALTIYYTKSPLPDLLTAIFIVSIASLGASRILVRAFQELKEIRSIKE